MYKYLTRYRDKYYPGLDVEHQSMIDDTIQQLQAFILLFPAPEIEPDVTA
jgi:hypothetical protein